MTRFGYYDESAALGRAESRWIDGPPEGKTPICDGCRNELEDCKNGIRSLEGRHPACKRCPTCQAIDGECSDECESKPLPAAQVEAADIIAEEGLQSHREERHS